MLHQILTKLDFTEKEIEVYLALLRHGKMVPAEIAKLTRISRPTVYSVAKELIKKGVVLEDLGGNSRTLVAKAPQDLAILTNREQKALDEKKKIVQSAIEELSRVAQHTKYTIPKIVFIPEEELNNYLHKQTLTWSESIRATDGVYWGFQDNTLVDYYQEWIDWYWQQPIKAPVVKLLSNVSDTERRMDVKAYKNRHIRFWSESGAFTATTWVMGNYVTMIVTNQRPHYLIEIHDAMVAQNLRQLFRGIWKSLDQKPT